VIKSLLLSPLAIGPSLRKYFRSGWAFLIPYLAAYLLYWWLRWPVNPMAGGGGVKVAGESGPLAPHALHLTPPALLHVYWALHAVNAMLAAIALVAYLRERHTGSVGPNPANTPTSAEDRQPVDFRPSTLDLMARLAPWLLLALLFYIPGVYLEFPADPWEHYGRVNEWSWLHLVGEHSAWSKSSYFLAYSLLGQISPPTRQLFWLDFYYTGCCLLLCWQYYRLARAVGLGERASFIFVLIQALTFGNNIFGFYRYYGISSSIFAQLGAVALIRIGVEFAASLPPRVRGAPRRSLGVVGCAALLLPFIAFNHVQGLGIAGLGLAAVVIWRLIEWRRSMIFWLTAAAIVLSVAAILWWPRHPALNKIYRSDGWLTSWYSFNLLTPNSAAFDRALVIPGGFGLVNLAIGLLLLRRNCVVGWLTVLPVVALCLPFIAIPFASALAEHYINVAEIVTFHRMLFAIPPGLAIVTLLDAAILAKEQGTKRKGQRVGRFLASGFLSFSFWGSALTALVLTPTRTPFYGRVWNALMVPADDLAMRHAIADFEELPFEEYRGVSRLLSTPGLGLVFHAAGVKNVFYNIWDSRTIISPVLTLPSARADIVVHLVAVGPQDRITGLLLVPPIALLQTPNSLAACLSGHWLSQEVALHHAGGPEAEVAARKAGGKLLAGAHATFYLFGDMATRGRKDGVRPTGDLTIGD
jgi:hypothetical protein